MYEVSRARRASLAALAFVAALFLIAFRTAMVAFVSYWVSNDVYFYAFLIPLISVLMVWARREEFLDIPMRPSLALGGVATAAGLAVLLFGQASNTNLIEEISVVITVAALTVLLAGRTVFRRFWFPVVYLLRRGSRTGGTSMKISCCCGCGRSCRPACG